MLISPMALSNASGASSGLKTLAETVQAVSGKLKSIREYQARSIGIAGLRFAHLDFQEKARHGTSAAGKSWKPITILAIGTRVLKLKAGAKMRKKLPGGPGKDKARAAILWRGCTDPKFVPDFYAEVQKQWANHSIGRDTGRMVNSLQPGKPDNTLRIEADNMLVIIGTDVESQPVAGISWITRTRYAPYFDKDRPIIDENFITSDRQNELDETAELTAQIAVDEAIKGAIQL